MLNFKKKKPNITFETKQVEEEPNVEEVRVFKDGEYSHSVKIMFWPESIIEELRKINSIKSCIYENTNQR